MPWLEALSVLVKLKTTLELLVESVDKPLQVNQIGGSRYLPFKLGRGLFSAKQGGTAEISRP